MKTIEPSALYWASFNRFELRMPGESVQDIAQSGQNDAAVEYWTPKILAQIEADDFANKPTVDSVRAELNEYGSWDDEELSDDGQNWNRLIWIAAWNIADSDDLDCSEPLKS